VEVGEFGGVDGGKSRRREANIVEVVGRWDEIEVLDSVVVKVVGSPFDDETRGLQEWLILVKGKGLDTRNGSIGDGENSPLVTRDAVTRSQR
jgi:hypothetical protein